MMRNECKSNSIVRNWQVPNWTKFERFEKENGQQFTIILAFLLFGQIIIVGAIIFICLEVIVIFIVIKVVIVDFGQT